MNKKFFSSFIIVIIFLLLTGFLLIKNDAYKKIEVGHIKYVKIAEHNVKVDLVLTPAEQVKGLSGRNELKEDEGMLFIFSRPGNYSFWMKDMNFPIDIIWIREDGEIVYIKKDARPELYPETYSPDNSAENAKYVLEVVSGFSEKNNLGKGDKVEFIY